MPENRKLKLTDWQVEYLKLLNGEGAFMTGDLRHGSWTLRAERGRGSYHVLPQHGRSLVRRGFMKSVDVPLGYSPRYCISELGMEALNHWRAGRLTPPVEGQGE